MGNVIGSVSYAGLYYIVTTKMGHIDPTSITTAQRIVEIAEIKTIGYAQYGFDGTITAFTSAVLCNWMVTLGAVMAFTSSTTSGKIAAMWLPIMTFFALGYEHAVVNMFLIPAGILFSANITIADWLLWNGLPVIAGNITGGMLFTGFMLYWTFKKNDNKRLLSNRKRVIRTNG